MPLAFVVLWGLPLFVVGVYRGFHVANGIQPMGRNSLVGSLPEDWGELPMSCTGIQRVWLWAMRTFLLTQGNFNGDPVDTDTVGGCMVMGRAIEIASDDGRSAIDLSRTDLEQAKQELTSEAE